MDVTHKKLKSSGLPEFLSQNDVKFVVPEGIFENRLNETVADELL